MTNWRDIKNSKYKIDVKDQFPSRKAEIIFNLQYVFQFRKFVIVGKKKLIVD